MDDFPWIKLITAFAVVFALLAAMGGILKYVSLRGITLGGKTASKRRMKIVETLPLDARRRCVIVRCDDREHLLLLGGEGDSVVETNLSPLEDRSGT
ncbi:MAG: flagellar biosynthetic protein FliO [Alphaproteobacteria bacterium]|nr:flagellar biosynthetic protein FliO [Alphaproteobacteria bacterium]